MGFPHYLTRSASGLYVFRMRVPADLREAMGRGFIKRGLGRDLLSARLAALGLSARYAAAFAQMRGQGMARNEDVDALIARLTNGSTRLPELTLERARMADGSIVERWQMDTPEDVRLYRQATAARAPRDLAALYEKDPLAAGLEGYVPPPPPPPPVAEVIALGKARDAWLKSMEATTHVKTLVVKKTAITALVDYLGANRQLHTIARPDLARFYQHLRDGGMATPTIHNKQSYLGGKGGLFDWAMASGYYPAGDNPAAGHVRFTAKEKRQRKKLGFKAFDAAQVRTLYSPEHFPRLSPGARWAALLGLYTGARAGEVGQLLTTDVFDADGVPAIRISDEGEHQRVKTDASNRIVPVHPDLLALGFLDYVDSLRSRGDVRIFPQASPDAKNGAGNWISKAFSYYLGKVAEGWPNAKRGFHSLRKTVIQEMQSAGVASEMRAQIVGHELDDEHHSTYSREFTAAEKLNGAGKSPGLSVLAYGLDLDALRPLLTEPGSMPRKRASKTSEAAASRSKPRKRSTKG
ncbi:MAG: site-specific integrase [Gammaproteobacteria bacterium]